MKVLKNIKNEMTRSEIQKKVGLKNNEYFRKAYLLLALGAGVIEMTFPDRPNSRLQKYRLTEKGQRVLGMKNWKIVFDSVRVHQSARNRARNFCEIIVKFWHDMKSRTKDNLRNLFQIVDIMIFF